MQYNIVYKLHELKALVKDLRREKSLAIDTETDSTIDGLNYQVSKMLTVQISNGREAWLIDRRTTDLQLLKPVLEDRDIEKIFHNFGFDGLWFLWEFGIRVQGIYDTMCGEKLMLGVELPLIIKKAERPLLMEHYSSSLEYCLRRRGLPDKLEFIPHTWFETFFLLEKKGRKAERYLKTVKLQDYWLWTKEEKKEYKYIRTIQDTQLATLTQKQIEYDIRDVEFLHEIKDSQEQYAASMDFENTLMLENLLTEVTVQMSFNGYGVDKAKWLLYAKENEKIYNEKLKQLERFADINWQSPEQACKYFGVTKVPDLEQFPEAAHYFKLAK